MRVYLITQYSRIDNHWVSTKKVVCKNKEIATKYFHQFLSEFNYKKFHVNEEELFASNKHFKIETDYMLVFEN